MADVVLTGFDTSKWQSGAYAGGGGFAFGFAKLTEGVGYKDDAADRHMAAILAQPIVPGGYHFSRPDLNPGTTGAYAEADWFWQVATSYGGARGMLLGNDQEAGSGNLGQWRDDFNGRLRWRLGGYNAAWYSYQDFILTRGLNYATDFWGWLAWPDSNGALPAVAFGVAMQQYGTVSVPGLSGGVDANRFFGTVAQLKELTVGGGAKPGPLPGGHAMWHPTIAGRWDDLVTGANSHVYHTWGTAPGQRGMEDWGGAGIPGTERLDWSPDGQHLLGRVVGVDALIYYRQVNLSGAVEFDWFAAAGESALLPPSGPVGAAGPPGPAGATYDDGDLRAQVAAIQTELRAVKAALP